MKKCAVISVLLMSAMASAEVQQKSISKVVDENLKVGYVSAPAVMESKRGKQVRSELEKKMNIAMQELQEDEQAIVGKENELKAKRSTLSATSFEDEQQKLRNMARNFETKRQEKAEEIKSAEQKANGILVEDTLKAAAEMARAKDLDVIIDKESGRALYVASKVDYTSDLRLTLDANFDAESKKANA